MKIGIVVNQAKDYASEYTKLLYNIIEEHNMNALVMTEEDFSYVDIVMSVGGDGTLIRTAKMACMYNKPVVGVNLGHLGYLAQIDKDNIKNCVARIACGDYKLCERMILDVSIRKGKSIVADDIAINDIVVSRGSEVRGIRISSYKDGNLINKYFADGVIVATPLGSTAYSLSAGGPVVDTEAQVVVLTPICPHSFSARSFIAPVESEIVITVDLKKDQLGTVVVDGSNSWDISEGVYVLIKKSKRLVKFIKFYDINCFERLN